MSEDHVRSDPYCSLRWKWVINARPWYIPRWWTRRVEGMVCPVCRNRLKAWLTEKLGVTS